MLHLTNLPVKYYAIHIALASYNDSDSYFRDQGFYASLLGSVEKLCLPIYLKTCHREEADS